jgi:hypothetical protein
MAISRTNIILSTLLLGALGGLGYLSLRLSRSRAENAQLAERQRVLIQQMEAISGTLKKQANAVGVKSGGNEVAGETGSNVIVPDRTEKLAKFIHRYKLRYVWSRYHDGIAALNLPREKQVQLLDLLRAREEAMDDARKVSWEMGVKDAKVSKAAENRAADSVNEEITTLIGSAGLDSLNDSLELKQRRMQVQGGVGAEMAMDGVPLTLDQETALARVYADLPKQFPGDPSLPWDNRPIEEVIREQEQIDAVVIEKASKILTPQQTVDLKASIDMESERLRVYAEPNK